MGHGFDAVESYTKGPWFESNHDNCIKLCFASNSFINGRKEKKLFHLISSSKLFEVLSFLFSHSTFTNYNVQIQTKETEITK